MNALFRLFCVVLFLAFSTATNEADLSEEFDSSERQSTDDEELEATDNADENTYDEEMENEEDESAEVSQALVRARRQRCPTITFPCSRMRSVCTNMRRALRRRKPRQLNRITNRSQIRRNRRLSGCRTLRRKPGHNCDEYPFASSRQGGTGAVIRLVPISENSRQGALLSIFYRRNGIGNGGCFRVSLGR